MEAERPLLPAKAQEVPQRVRPKLDEIEPVSIAPLVRPAPQPEPKPPVSTVSSVADIAAALNAKPSNACDWASVQAAAAGERRQLKMIVEEAALLEFKDGLVALRVASDLMRTATVVQEELRQLITRTWGRNVRVEFATEAERASVAGASESSVRAQAGGGVERTENGSSRAAEAGPSMTVANALENPLIAKAAELLGAKVVGVYVRQK